MAGYNLSNLQTDIRNYTEVDSNVVEVAPYGVADCSAITDAKTDLVVLVYGSEFAKGTSYNLSLIHI